MADTQHPSKLYQRVLPVLLALVCVQTALSANDYKLSPAVVQRGETTTVTLNVSGCPSSAVELDKNSIEISGNGIVLSVETARVTDCSVAIQAQMSKAEPSRGDVWDLGL